MNKSLILIALLCCSALAQGAPLGSLYQVEVPVQDQSAAARLQGMSAAIKQMLVRVSGHREVVEQAALAAAIASPARYINGYRYTSYEPEEGVLVVDFNPGAVQKLLLDNHLPVWSAQRPDVLLWLAVEEGRDRYLAKDSRVHLPQQAVQAAAARRGLPVVWPLGSDIDAGKVKFADIKGQFAEPILAASRDYAAHSILTGHVRQRGEQDWQAQWQLLRDEQALRWDSSGASLQAVIDGGIDKAADQYAAEFAVVLEAHQENLPLRVRVENIHKLEDYAAASAYLRQLLLTKTLAVAQIAPDSIEFQLALQGSVDAWARAIRLGGTMRIVPQTTPVAAQTPGLDSPAAPAPDYILELL